MTPHTGYSRYLNYIVLMGDLVCVQLCFILLFQHFKAEGYLPFKIIALGRPLFITINLSYLLAFWITSTSNASRTMFAEKIVQKISYTVFIHFIIFSSLLVFLKIEDLSRAFIILLYCLLLFSLLCWRLTLHFSLKQFRKKGHGYKKVIIIGAGKNGQSLYQEITAEPAYGYRVTGFFEDNTSQITNKQTLLGKTDEAIEYLKNNAINEVYCTLPESAEQKITEIAIYCENNRIHFSIIPTSRRYIKKRVALKMIGTIPTLCFQKEPLEHRDNRLVKRGFDLLFSTLFLCTLYLPILFLVAIAIKLSSPGPLLFKQLRTGRNGEEFICYKFRTMKQNKEADKVQTTRDDPRKTKIGNLLRKTNIDELPQFWNVFKGNMSIVGPRPHMLQHTDQYSQLIEKYMIRHAVKPGITGWAQVTGFRGETKLLSQMEGRVKQDVWYIENWSFWLDLKIIAKTVFNMIRGDKNAF